MSVTRKEVLIQVGYFLASLALEGCSRKDKPDFNFLKNKRGNWDNNEIRDVGVQMQKCPGGKTKDNGRWLENLGRGRARLSGMNQYLGEMTLVTKSTKVVLGQATLATTRFAEDKNSSLYNPEIEVNPKIFAGSNEVICLILGKELQNIWAATNSSREHQNRVEANSERDFWQKYSQDQAIVLIDGRAYWEMLDDYRKVLAALGGNYKRLNQTDQELLGSFSILSRFALQNGLIVESEGRWVQNPKLDIPGYIHPVWVQYFKSLYKSSYLHSVVMWKESPRGESIGEF